MNTKLTTVCQRPHIENSHRYALSVEYSDIVDALIRLRKNKNLSQAELARRLDMSRQGLHNWEAKRRHATLDDLIRWAEVLGSDLSISLSRRGPSPQQALINQLGQLDDTAAGLVQRMAGLLAEMDERDRFALASYLEALEASYERMRERASS